MNYLAHVYLARHSEEAMVGALLGDFVRADISGRFGAVMEAEIRVHRRVDAFTDTHPAVVEARRLFGGGRRRFAGIALDVFYDHLLTLEWNAFCDEPLPEFLMRFYAALATYSMRLPAEVRPIAARIAAQDWLGSYGTRAGVDATVSRISQRLSRNGHLLRECLPELDTHAPAIRRGFDALFPELVAYAQAQRAQVSAAARGH